MVLPFQHPQYPGRPVHSNAMRELLGLAPKAKLPPEGMEPRMIGPVLVFVTPVDPKRRVRRGGGMHRVMAVCPHCDAVMSAGRLFQHSCYRKETA